ncbi:universal stress protein [Devosia sp.]|uniref:universal stress protein n=1 Tax=Devosia sp. TaxID=1871048 RepID=UPI001ACE6DE8|nr:universal stress protein [Devosia sp.]MBN9309290.1 universal stress protein [Devosia sp.]
MSEAPRITLGHITLATDLTARTDRAFDRAVGLARQWNARLLIVHAVEERERVTDHPSWRRGADPVQAARMKLQFDYPGWEGVDTAIEVKVGTPQEVILAAAARERTDLIITGIAREDFYGRDDLGALVPVLAQKAPAPLLVVKKRPVGPPRRVVVATDLTDTSHAALDLALGLFGPGRLTLFNAFDIPYRGLAGDRAELERTMRPGVIEECRAMLVAAAGAAAAAQVEIIAELGAPAPILAKLVTDRDIDLVVTGTYGHSGIMDVLLGSTAMDIMSLVSCDVLVARRKV